jgi:hypothetical protein
MTRAAAKTKRSRRPAPSPAAAQVQPYDVPLPLPPPARCCHFAGQGRSGCTGDALVQRGEVLLCGSCSDVTGSSVGRLPRRLLTEPPPAAAVVVEWPEALRLVAEQRAVLETATREAVARARRLGASWDRISAELGGSPSGEHLRRTYGAGLVP